MRATKLGRNDPCHCGSGKKYKKCCLITEEGTAALARQAEASQSRESAVVEGTKLSIVKSTLWNGQRFRAIWNGLHARPGKESFHDFILWLMQETLDQGWVREQRELPAEQRHAIVNWLATFDNLEDSPMRLQKGVYVTSGPMESALRLAYDLYLLQVVNRLPGEVVKRLKNREEFQGVRYEIAVASVFARADFEIAWMDKNDKNRHCELIAKHKATGTEVYVEAKSRQRPGVLHRSGKFDDTDEMKAGVRGLYESARGQGSPSHPFVIFIDANLPTDNLPPPEPETMSLPISAVAWVMEIDTMLKDDWGIEGRLPSKDTLVVVTNFAPHYGEPDVIAPEGIYAFVPSPDPQNSIDGHVIKDLDYCLRNYAKIPKEV